MNADFKNALACSQGCYRIPAQCNDKGVPHPSEFKFNSCWLPIPPSKTPPS